MDWQQLGPNCPEVQAQDVVVGQSHVIGWDHIAPAPSLASAFLALRSVTLARASGQSPGRGYRHSDVHHQTPHYSLVLPPGSTVVR